MRRILTSLALVSAVLIAPAAADAEPAPQSSTRIGAGIRVESTGGCLLGLPTEGPNGTTVCYTIDG